MNYKSILPDKIYSTLCTSYSRSMASGGLAFFVPEIVFIYYWSVWWFSQIFSKCKWKLFVERPYKKIL